MLKKRFLLSITAVLLCAVLMFSACASSSKGAGTASSSVSHYSQMANDAAAPASESPRTEEYALDSGESGLGGSAQVISAPASGTRKLIWTGDISIRSKEFDADMQAVTGMIESAGGWVEYSNISGLPFTEADGYGRRANLTARVPISKFEGFMSNLSSVGVTSNVSSYSEDISLRYSETDLRKKSVQTQLDRILLLMEKADKMDDIIKLEQEISRLTYELEVLSGQLVKWDNAVDYATVSIYMNEEKSYNVTYTTSFNEKLANSFSYGLSAFRLFLEGLVLSIAGGLPFLILAVIIIIIILKVVKSKRKNKKKTKKRAAGDSSVPSGFGQVTDLQAPPEPAPGDESAPKE